MRFSLIFQFFVMLQYKFTYSWSLGRTNWVNSMISRRISVRYASSSSDAVEEESKSKVTFQDRKKLRREHIGRPKAQDRGQFSNIYSVEYNSAKSGLPDRTKPFTVLGIESRYVSCCFSHTSHNENIIFSLFM